MKDVEERGVDLATGHGDKIWDLNPKLAAKVDELYDDAKKSLWTELTPEFITTIPGVLPVRTLSTDRHEYFARPSTGERLSPGSIIALERMSDSWGANQPKGPIVISDGLNAKAIMDQGHLAPYLEEIRSGRNPEIAGRGRHSDERQKHPDHKRTSPGRISHRRDAL